MNSRHWKIWELYRCGHLFFRWASSSGCDFYAVVWSGTDRNEAQRSINSVYPGAYIWDCSLPLHLCIHGADAWGDIYASGNQRYLWYNIVAVVWHRSLFCHCPGGTFTEVVQRYLNWNERSKGAKIVKKVCGMLVILGGVYLIYTAL